MILLVFGLYNRQEKAFNWILLPATLLAISLFFIIFKVNLGFLPPGPIEISPSFSHNFEITKKVLEKKPIFGTGPGTFVYNFSLYKDVSLNQTAFWQIRFISGASEILENLANSGILWLLGFLGIFFSFVFLGIKKLLIEIKENDFEKMIGISCLACFFALSTSFFFYPANLSLWLLWWFFGAGILIINFKELKEWQIKPKRISSLLIPLIFIISLIGSLAIFVSISERYFAQINHLRGLEALAEGEREKSLNLINWASQINPLVDIYWQDLSQVALNLLNQEIAKAPTDEKPEDKTRKIQFYFNLAINSAKRATDAAPYNVAGWINRGFVYQSAIGLTQGSFDWALKSYEKAKELEPTNPFIPLQIARAYLAKAILSRQLEKEKEVKELIEKAKEELKKSIELKNNYWPAHFQQAVIFDFEGKLNEAISKLEEIKPFNLQDPGFAFQLGSLYWRKEEMRKAREEFERAINLFPNFANARYFLGLAFDKLGEKEKAIEQFEKIASFSKENAEQVAKILENLRKGLPALGKEIEAPPAPEEIPALEEQQP
jgi:tetratricopeptide (TPR) repeat protein